MRQCYGNDLMPGFTSSALKGIAKDAQTVFRRTTRKHYDEVWRNQLSDKGMHLLATDS